MCIAIVDSCALWILYFDYMCSHGNVLKDKAVINLCVYKENISVSGCSHALFMSLKDDALLLVT